MRIISFLLLFLSLFISWQGSAAGKKKVKHASKSSRKTTAKVEGAGFQFKDGDTHDFGQLTAGPDATHEFSFLNSGNQPLILQNVQPSCSCISLEWPRHPILPGSKGTIKVSFHTSKVGTFSKEVHIQSNAVATNGEKDPVIYIKGNVTQ